MAPTPAASRQTADTDSASLDLTGLPRSRLEAMLDAGEEVVRCQRVLARAGENVISELLRDAEFFEWDHHPPGDVYDPETHAQYYYHAHPGPTDSREHGHFHTFLRGPGMSPSARAITGPGGKPPPDRKNALAHLVAISMDEFGKPVRLFTINRWVTDETWYDARDVIAMLDRFVVDLARPSWPVNRWITAMIDLFRPQIEALIEARDAAVSRRAAQFGEDVYDDHALEVTADRSIDVDQQLDAVAAALSSPR